MLYSVLSALHGGAEGVPIGYRHRPSVGTGHPIQVLHRFYSTGFLKKDLKLPVFQALLPNVEALGIALFHGYFIMGHSP